MNYVPAVAYHLRLNLPAAISQLGAHFLVQPSLYYCPSPSYLQIVKMLIALMVIFGVCWLPYHAYFLALYYVPTLGGIYGIQVREKHNYQETT